MWADSTRMLLFQSVLIWPFVAQKIIEYLIFSLRGGIIIDAVNSRKWR